MMTIREARISDLHNMFLISVKAHRQGYDSMIPVYGRVSFYARYAVSEENEQAFVHIMRRRLSDPERRAWVAVVGKATVGYVVACRVDDSGGRVTSLFVSPSHQGRGVGRQLLEVALDWLGSGTITMQVLTLNTRALDLYARFGFRDSGPASGCFFGAEQRILRRDH